MSGRARWPAGLVRISGAVAVALPRGRMLRALRGKFGLLLLALAALVLFAPVLAARDGWWVGLTGLLGAATLLAALHAARPGRGVLVLGLVLTLADFALGRLALALDRREVLALQAAVWLVLLLYVTAAILDAVFESRHVDLGTLQAALCVYLLIGLIGAFAFALADLIVPGTFALAAGGPLPWGDRANVRSFMKLLAMSFATISGVGGGEVVPVGPFAENALSLEAMVGQIYLAVVVARLVGVEAAGDASRSSAGGG